VTPPTPRFVRNHPPHAAITSAVECGELVRKMTSGTVVPARETTSFLYLARNGKRPEASS